MKEGYSVVLFFAGLCAVTGVAAGVEAVHGYSRVSSTPASVTIVSVPAPKPPPLAGARELSQMGEWWDATQRAQRRPQAHPPERRKSGGRTVLAAQQTWAATVASPEVPRYVLDASRWPIHGPAGP